MCENSDACKATGNEKGVPHIEVTPEMIEAGVLVLRRRDDDFDSDAATVMRIVRAIASAGQLPIYEAPLSPLSADQSDWWQP